MTVPPFRFLHEPHTEQEVVCLFVALLNDLDEFDRPVVIETVRMAFPDCTIRAGGHPIRIEFELFGSSFDHSCDGCDLLVCWRDDHNVWPAGFRVLELAPIIKTKHPDLILSVDENYPAPWNETTFFAAAERHGTSPSDIALARRVIELAREHGFGPVWLKNPKPVFAVGTPHRFFKVRATGKIGFPFFRLPAGDSFPELVARLNGVVPKLGLQTSDVGTKGRGGMLSELFQNDQQVQEFFGVWSWFNSTER